MTFYTDSVVLSSRKDTMTPGQSIAASKARDSKTSSLFPYELAEFPCGGLRLVRSTVRK